MSQAYAAAYSFAGGRKDYNFGDPERMKSSKMFPGPGNYTDVDIKHIASKTTTYSFAKEPRMQSAKTILPGPGTYSYEKTEVHKQRMPKFSLGKSERSMDLFVTEGGSQFFQSSKEKVRSSSPGPGHYELDAGFTKTKPRVTSVAVVKSQRGVDFNKNNMKTPGPGAYENDIGKVKNRNPTFTLSKQIREDPFLIHRQKEKLPGPGVYNVNTTIGTGQKKYVKRKA